MPAFSSRKGRIELASNRLENALQSVVEAMQTERKRVQEVSLLVGEPASTLPGRQSDLHRRFNVIAFMGDALLERAQVETQDQPPPVRQVPK